MNIAATAYGLASIGLIVVMALRPAVEPPAPQTSKNEATIVEMVESGESADADATSSDEPMLSDSAPTGTAPAIILPSSPPQPTEPTESTQTSEPAGDTPKP